MSWLFIIIPVLIVVAIKYVLKQREFKGIPNIGFFELLRNKKDFPLWTARISNQTKSKFIGVELGIFRGLIATHPDSVKFVLKNEDLFPKARGLRSSKLQSLITKNVLNSNGEEWKAHRAVMNPAFQFEAIKHCTEVFKENTNEVLKIWDNLRRDGPIEVVEWMVRFTMDSLGKALFNIEFNMVKGGDQRFAQAYQTIFAYMGSPSQRLTSFVPFLPSTKKLEKACEVIHEMIDQIKMSKLAPQSGITKFNTLDLAYQLFQDDNGLDDENKIADTLILFIAGHETTATALSWTMYLLANHPDIQSDLRSEITDTLKGNDITHEDLKKLPFLSKVIKESLRMYPPATFVLSRIVEHDTEFEGIKIPKGVRIGTGTAALHRREDVWEDANVFNPNRFDTANINPWSYAPFSLGTRNCVGLNFATVEMQVFLVMLLQRFRIESTNHKPEPSGNLIVWQVDKMYLKFIPI